MLETHLDSCVVDAFHSDNEANKNEKIQELTKLYKK
jgi:DNA-binding FrmR family transcriptional regulator